MGVQNLSCQPVLHACRRHASAGSLFSNHHMPAAGILCRVWEPEIHTHTPNPAGKRTGQDRVHPNPRMWKVDGEESYLQAKAWGFGGNLVVFSKTISGLFVCFFLISSVCSKFQTSTKRPDQQPLETKVLVSPKNRNNECLWNVSSSKASPRHPLMNQAWCSW